MNQMNLKITILNDNSAGGQCSARHGLSFLIEAGRTFLFDTGPSDIIFENARILGIGLEKVETIVLSHAHYDHTGGLKYFSGQEVIAHPRVFAGHFRKDASYIGMPLSFEEARERFTLRLSREPLWLSDTVVFLGEIPRVNNFEAQTSPFLDEAGNEDFIPDDSGVAIKTNEGLVVISGCAHAGICNTVEQAVKVTGESRISAVMGGFHLNEDDEITSKTIEWLKAKQVKKVMPSHCTELPALAAFYREWPFRQIKSGQVLLF